MLFDAILVSARPMPVLSTFKVPNIEMYAVFEMDTVKHLPPLTAQKFNRRILRQALKLCVCLSFIRQISFYTKMS